MLTYLARLFNGQTFGYENDNAVALIVFALLTLSVLFRMPRADALYAGSTLLIFMMRFYETARLESMTHYVLQLFPCFIAGECYCAADRCWSFMQHWLLSPKSCS